MTFTSNVAPRRRVREKHWPWSCNCVVGKDRHDPGYLKTQPASVKRCYVCLAVRP